MSSQSEYAGTVGTGNFVGSGTAWSSASNATGATDSNFATCTMTHGASSESLDLYDWGFSIPGGATINGLAATVTAKESTGTSVEFLATYIEIASTTGAFTASSLAGTALTATSAGYTTGSSTDQAGFSGTQLTSSNANSNVENTGITFGATFKNLSGGGTFAADVDAVQFTVYYTSSPPTPTGLAVANDATNPTTVLDVSWNASAGATSYTLLQSTTKAGTFTTVQSGISGTSTTVTGLTPGSEYAFEVEAVGSGGTSAASSPVAWATEAAAPTGLSAAETGTSITVSLTAPSVGSNVAINQYNFRYEYPPGAGNWTTGNASSAPFTITGLTPGTQYGIEVATNIGSTNSDWTDPGGLVGPWSTELIAVTPINAIPARCNVVMARKIHGWTIKTF